MSSDGKGDSAWPLGVGMAGFVLFHWLDDPVRKLVLAAAGTLVSVGVGGLIGRLPRSNYFARTAALVEAGESPDPGVLVPGTAGANLYALMIALGLGTILLSATYLQPKSLAAELALMWGGAILSVGLGGSISTRKAHRLFLQVARSLSADVDRIEQFSGAYHRYTVTKIDGQYVWRYTKPSLSSKVRRGHVLGRVEIPGPDRKNVAYNLEGSVRDDRLVLYSRRGQGTESTAVQLFPRFTRDHLKITSGVQIVETYDGDAALAPCLIAREPLLENQAVGSVDDERAAALLDKTWVRSFAAEHDILPRTERASIATSHFSYGSVVNLAAVADAVLSIRERPDDLRVLLLRAIERQAPIPAKFLYLTEQGTACWLELCRGRFHRESVKHLAQAAPEIAALCQRHARSPNIDFVSLGSGDGKKDLVLIKSLLRAAEASPAGDGDVFYFPIDISESLLATALVEVRNGFGGAEHAFRLKAIVGDITRLPDYEAVLRPTGTTRLYSVLGNTLGNADEDEIIDAISARLRSGDLVLVEARIGQAEHDVYVDETAIRHDFAPLEWLGLKLERPKLTHRVAPTSASSVPGASTVLTRYEKARIQHYEGDVVLSVVHFYDFRQLEVNLRKRLNADLIRSWHFGQTGLLLLKR
jgi:hypothetical protein